MPTSLRPCPRRPNCVSSQADNPSQQVDPLPVLNGVDHVIEKLAQVIGRFPRTKIVEKTDRYLHVEFRSRLFRFVDDVELILSQDSSIVHVRSASRTGYSDLGVNRKRVEKIRQCWQQEIETTD